MTIKLTSRHYAIIADSPLFNEGLIKKAIVNKVVVALDGAANHLRKDGIMPDVILGDFDSIDQQSQAYWGITKTFAQLSLDDKPYTGNYHVCIVPMLNQNLTDLEKAIRFCDDQGAEAITLLAATGGREDLHEGMKIALKEAYHPKRPILAHTDLQTLRYAQNESIHFYGQPGDYCGFIAIHTGQGSTEGLDYECHNAEYSICNRLKAHTATIHIQGSGLVIMPLQLA